MLQFPGILLFLILLVLPLNLAQAWFEEQAQDALEQRWMPMLGSSLLEERFRAIQAFYAFPEWSLPLLRKSLDQGGTMLETWRAAMLLGVMGNQDDLERLFRIQQKNLKLERPEVWEGAMERLYWKYRLPPHPGVKLKNLMMTKTRKVDHSGTYQRSAVSLEFLINNPSSQTLLLKPMFDFWVGQPESPPEESWIRVKAKNAVKIRIPLMFRIPFGRGKVRIDMRLQELGAGQPLIHQLVFLALDS